MKKCLIFIVLITLNLTTYSQINLVKSIVIGNDTLNCINREQTISLLDEFALCDSYRDSLSIIVEKMSIANSLIHTDSLLLENYKADLKLADSQIEQKNIQITSLTEIVKLADKEKKRLKRKQWLIGGLGFGGGVLGGLLLGIFIK